MAMEDDVAVPTFLGRVFQIPSQQFSHVIGDVLRGGRWGKCHYVRGSERYMYMC